MQKISNGTPASLVGHLETEFTQAAGQQQAELRTELERIAGQGQERRPLKEKGYFWTYLCLIIGAILVFQGFNRVFYKPDLAAILVCLGVGGALVALGIYFLRRSRVPFMTLTDKGILFANLTTEIPWTAVVDWNTGAFQVNSNGIFFLMWYEVGIVIDEGFQMPAFSGDRRVKFKIRKHPLDKTKVPVLGFKPFDFGSMDADGFDDLFATYLNAARARAQLAQMA